MMSGTGVLQLEMLVKVVLFWQSAEPRKLLQQGVDQILHQTNY